MDQSCKVANPACGQLNRENDFSTCWALFLGGGGGKIPVRVTTPRFELTSQHQKVSRLTTEPPGRPGVQYMYRFSKKNLNACRPSEHPSVRGKKLSKHLGGIIGCKYKTSSWHLNGFPDGSNRSTVVLFYPPKENLNASKPSNESKGLGGNIGCRDKNSTWY